jgi:hypothetical protein
MIRQMKRLSVCLLLFAVTSVFAQNRSDQGFVIDRSKPYVYLKFDHIGPRKPIQKGETDSGLWIRVVNNCRIPIIFTSFTVSDGDTGVGLMDEVVDVEPMLQFSYTPAEVKDAQKHERLRRLKHKPTGYSSETTGIARVQPGEDLLFSVPLNHVDEDWYMRVKFALDLSPSSISVGPFTYLPFYEWDIPKEFRDAKGSGAAYYPEKPTSMLLHESCRVLDPAN